MSEENVESVRRLFAAWAQGDFDAGPEYFDRDVLLVLRTFDTGVYHGLEGIRDYARTLLEPWERYALELEAVEVNGDTVLATVRQSGVGKVSGIEGELRLFQVFSFRAGRVIRFDTFLDEAAARKAAGLSQ
jgi:ketosteroid isomerase-like protein